MTDISFTDAKITSKSMKEGLSAGQPFKDDLSPHEKATGSSSDLLQLRNDPRFVFRSTSIEAIQKGYKDKYGEEVTPGAVVQRVSTAQKLLEASGVRAPVMRVVAKDDLNRDAIFSVAPLIKSASEDLRPGTAMFNKFVELCGNLFSYYKNAYETKTDYFSDIWSISSQYLYGMKEGDTENNWYLVDVDPYFMSRPDMDLLGNIKYIHDDLSMWSTDHANHDGLASLITEMQEYLQDHPFTPPQEA